MIKVALDGIMIHHLVEEINFLENGKIGKISQVGNNDFLFVVRANGKNNKLFISLERNQYRIALTDKEYIAPSNATMFTMLLRKHFEGGTIEKIYQHDLDRIVIFKVIKANEFQDKKDIRPIVITSPRQFAHNHIVFLPIARSNIGIPILTLHSVD